MEKEMKEGKEVKEEKEVKEDKEETEINICSICCCEITLQTGNSLLSCQHSFHLKCISQWLSKNNSCPCCRNQVSLEFENLQCLENGDNGDERDEARDELNERIDELENDENEGNAGDEGDEGSYNDEDFGGLIMISIGGLKELGEFYCRACFDDNNDDENENEERNKLLEDFNLKLTEDFFDNFCGGATISVRFDSRNVIPFTQQHFSHCFIKYYPTYLFFLGFFCKSAKINAFWKLWERIRVRQNTLGMFQNDFSINSSFILSVIRDHNLILSAPQTSFVNYLISPYRERELNFFLAPNSTRIITSFLAHEDLFVRDLVSFSDNEGMNELVENDEIIGV
jgi:hypothetical protein